MQVDWTTERHIDTFIIPQPARHLPLYTGGRWRATITPNSSLLITNY